MNNIFMQITTFEPTLFPAVVEDIIFQYAYGKSVDEVNKYIQTLLLRSRFAPIPPLWSRIFDEHRIIWKNVLDGDWSFKITKIIDFRRVLDFVDWLKGIRICLFVCFSLSESLKGIQLFGWLVLFSAECFVSGDLLKGNRHY